MKSSLSLIFNFPMFTDFYIRPSLHVTFKAVISMSAYRSSEHLILLVGNRLPKSK